MNLRTLKATRSLLLAPFAAFCLAATAQVAQPMAASASMPMGHMHADGGDMKQSMMGDMDSMQKMQMSGDTDKDFATMMKVHHQGGIDMAQMELAHGKSPAMKEMAKHIVAAQKKEIAEFDRWLATQK